MAGQAYLSEFCAENLTDIAAALEAGAGRIELCDNLAVGGTTPSAGVIEQAVALAHDRAAEVRVIIRPRGGDFVYSEDEFRAMETDIRYACANGADGVVLGCLLPHPSGTGFALDLPGTERLVRVARSLGEMRGREVGVTFHMAFDELAPSDVLAAIDALADLGVDRVLTHGGPAGTPIEDNFDALRACFDRAADRLLVLPGGGITYENAPVVAEALGAPELHGTRVVPLG